MLKGPFTDNQHGAVPENLSQRLGLIGGSTARVLTGKYVIMGLILTELRDFFRVRKEPQECLLFRSGKKLLGGLDALEHTETSFYPPFLSPNVQISRFPRDEEFVRIPLVPADQNPRADVPRR